MLSNERKLEIYTERLWRLAMDLAMQASMGGKERHGIAIVAEETRIMSNRLYCMLEIEDNETIRASIGDALLQLKYLSFNGWLEMLKVVKGFDPMNHITSPIAVIMEEIRNVTDDVRSLFGITDPKPHLPQPELKHASNVTNSQLFLIQATIGGEAFVENTAYVEEVVTYVDGDERFGIRDGCLKLRSNNIPVIDCYTLLNLDRSGIVDIAGRSCAMIINTAWEKESTKYAVLVDALPSSFGFFARFSEGKNVDSRSNVFTNQHVRASWDTADDEQMLFLDWKALNKH